MNYYKQVAEMLAVELNEEFRLKNKNGKLLSKKYRISPIDGLLLKIGDEWHQSDFIGEIISGNLTIVKLPWKPKDVEHYWYCSETREPVAIETIWAGTSGDLCKWKCGNCFKTKEEANAKGKEIMEKLVKEYIEL
jgi:hypothetical protein